MLKQSSKIQIKIMQIPESHSRQILKNNNNPWHRSWHWYHCWVFPRVHATHTRRNNSKETYIHQIMPWIAFKNLKIVQVTYCDSWNLVLLLFTCPSHSVVVNQQYPKQNTSKSNPHQRYEWKTLSVRSLKLKNFP